tara:strand:- start:62 stop:562 length:501 start_codon:yes stop_codon:yes gene_type:complete
LKLIENSISNDLFKNCVKELNEKLSENCWTSSSLTWGSTIKNGIVGSCVVTPVSDAIHHLLEKELKSYLPNYDELMCQYYIWQPQSGISWHNDYSSNRLFGATLYLNEQWHPDNGGWFIWEGKDGYHTILPKKKVLVVNDEYQHHCVTPVAIDFRCTIQIWGINNQ